jgi:hypothetical protein
VPTGRISIESVFRMLLTDLRIRPRREDFHQVLDQAEELLNQNRSWPSSPAPARPARSARSGRGRGR